MRNTYPVEYWKNILKNGMMLVSALLFFAFHAFGQSSAVNLDRPSDTKLRIGSYNVFWGSAFPQDDGSPPVGPERHGMIPRTANFVRIHNAVKPDVWALQELLYSGIENRSKSPEGILKYFEEITSEDWNVAADNRGRLVLSRYPIVWEKELVLRVFAVLIDLPKSISPEDLLMINVHLHWMDPDQRLKEGKVIASFLKKVMNGEVEGISSDSLLIVCGDFNSRPGEPPYRVVGSVDSGVSLEGEYESILKDSYPVQLGGDDLTTAGSVLFDGESKTIQGGTIDSVLFRPGILKISNSYILNTLILDQTILDAKGLRRNDVAKDPNNELTGAISFDHLPIISDFAVVKK